MRLTKTRWFKPVFLLQYVVIWCHFQFSFLSTSSLCGLYESLLSITRPSTLVSLTTRISLSSIGNFSGIISLLFSAVEKHTISVLFFWQLITMRHFFVHFDTEKKRKEKKERKKEKEGKRKEKKETYHPFPLDHSTIPSPLTITFPMTITFPIPLLSPLLPPDHYFPLTIISPLTITSPWPLLSPDHYFPSDCYFPLTIPLPDYSFWWLSFPLTMPSPWLYFPGLSFLLNFLPPHYHYFPLTIPSCCLLITFPLTIHPPPPD